MNSDKHARLTAKGRALLVSRVLEERRGVAMASDAAGVSERTGTGGWRVTDPRVRGGTTVPGLWRWGEVVEFERLRRQRWPLWRIARQARRGLATVSRCMQRFGLSRQRSLLSFA